MLRYHRPTPEAYASLKRRLEEPSLRDVFFGALQAMGKLAAGRRGCDASRERFEARARAVHELYKDEHHHRDWIDVCERLTEFDELVVSWRLRHIQLVERIIGIRMGTGGSAGASYLKLTLDKKFFPELWEARTSADRVTERIVSCFRTLVQDRFKLRTSRRISQMKSMHLTKSR